MARTYKQLTCQAAPWGKPFKLVDNLWGTLNKKPQAKRFDFFSPAVGLQTRFFEFQKSRKSGPILNKINPGSSFGQKIRPI